uniref:ATP synthase CF1 subunit epsilon n=1 Tax=Meringosphaera mediterranea TaxID=2837474 RepID=UPI00286AA90C|nr:ATP synthase CF1 subunit epsilon [Meringosphaera mediterranea]WLD05748.1 ATP synthase CF1 subunit epsilon [Meringosphaera mediterranea]WLD05842.1 ATP synthase CF1 subunit epsilon [Meringosphaera mediterranea]WLD06062.1 ATP synthase CF1 subunit epsilon [Meringosphaera mediterranea]
MSLNIQVITPDRVVLSTSATEAILPSTTGQVGVLVNHAPLLTAIDVGVLRFKVDSKWKPLVLFGGFAEVIDDKVTILVNGIAEIDPDARESVKAELKEASEQLDKATTDKEKIAAAVAVKRSSAKVDAYQFL